MLFSRCFVRQRAGITRRGELIAPAARAVLIRDRNKLEFVRSRFCSASFRFAPCCAAPGTRNRASEF